MRRRTVTDRRGPDDPGALHVLHEAKERYIEVVVRPAFKKPRGEARIRAIFERTMNEWEESLPGGCIFHAVAAELDDQPGPARDYLVSIQEEQRPNIRVCIWCYLLLGLRKSELLCAKWSDLDRERRTLTIPTREAHEALAGVEHRFVEMERWATEFERTLVALQSDYVDLFLIHWPMVLSYGGDFISTWKVFEELKACLALPAAPTKEIRVNPLWQQNTG